MRINTITLNPLKLFNHTLFHNSYRKYYLASIAYHNSCRRFALGICNHRNYRKDFLLHLLHDNLDILSLQYLQMAFAELHILIHIHQKLVLENEDKVLPLPDMYGKNLTFKTGGVDGCDCEEILRLIEEGKIDTTPLITHRFPLSQIEEAYRLFENKEDGVIKVAVYN